MFLKKNNDSLMWAHYADKHKGLCLVYDKNILLKHLLVTDPDMEMKIVNYGVTPTITLSEYKDTINFNSDIPIATTKNINWKYEQEIRFIIQKYNDFQGKSFPIGATPLKAVIYGYQIWEENKDAISEILAKDFEYKNVKAYNSEINYSTGKIEIIPE